jgi:hypothetical protein
LVAFGVCEYRFVFRRVLRQVGQTLGHSPGAAGRDDTARHPTRWTVARPIRRLPDLPARGVTRGVPVASPAGERTHEGKGAHVFEQVFIVPFCSTLALDDLAYERFLSQCGALDAALALLSSLTLAEPISAETVRKEIQSLLMAAEVQYIVDGMSA